MSRDEVAETAPEVGMLATKRYPSDSYPLVITRVSDSGKTFWAKPMNTDGAKPAYYHGPFPVMETVYTPEEGQERIQHESREIRVTHTRYGWRIGGQRGTPVSVGRGVYRIDYSL